LRQFQRQHGSIPPLGMWTGYDVKRWRVKEHAKISKPEKFWKAIAKFAQEHTETRRPWSSTLVYQDLLKAVHVNANVRPVAEMFKAHLEVSVLQKPAPTNGVPVNYESQGGVTQSPPVNWLETTEQYVFSSVSDLSNAPMSLSFVFFRERAFCTVTYNNHWLSEDSVKALVIALTRVLTRVVSQQTPHTHTLPIPKHI
jgi:hypothetical protein